MNNGTKPCPSCGERRCSVSDSRPSKIEGAIWRRVYRCAICGVSFVTVESVIAIQGQAVPNTAMASAAGFLRDVEKSAAAWFGSGRAGLHVNATLGSGKK